MKNRHRSATVASIAPPAAFALIGATLLISPDGAHAAKKGVSAKAGTATAEVTKNSAAFDPVAVENRASHPVLKRGSRGPEVVRAAVLLDRAWFSPGEIDGAAGPGFVGAVRAFQSAHGLPPTGVVDEAAWAELERDSGPALGRYTVTAEDAAYPFVPIPEDMMEKAKVPALGYSDIAELIGERFHVSPKLLAALNGGKTAFAVGEALLAPAIDTPAPVPAGERTILVDKSDGSVAVTVGGTVACRFPATMGSRRDPLPLGKWKVTGVSQMPPFHYNPDLFWDADAKDEKTTIRPGPNNPVGVAWIDLSKPRYGIHGTPEPSTIGRSESHGCIRLTNWDVNRLAGLVEPGTPAVLQR